jgi:hypothetical protein
MVTAGKKVPGAIEVQTLPWIQTQMLAEKLQPNQGNGLDL